MKLCLKRNAEHRRGHLAKRSRRYWTSSAKAKCKRQKKPWGGNRQSARLAVPYAFAIGGDQNRQTLMKFFSKMRELALERRLKVTLDFQACDVTHATRMLLFVAELDRIKRILGDDFSFSVENVRKRRINQLLYQIGVYNLCNIKRNPADEEAFDETVQHWRYATGERINEQANKAFASIEGRLSPELAKGMWKSVSEAVVNSIQHAYMAPRGVNGPRMGHARWCMFSQERDGVLTVAACDLGIGIPRSLPINWQPTMLKRVMDAFSADGPDVRAIRGALAIGASSTSESHRGRGLPQIWNELRSVSGASVTIISNKGQLAWNGETKQEFPMEFGVSILGTVIIWTVPVIASHGE